MKKATVFFSTAALMAGTACGVWAETNDTSASSFDRVERSIYDSNINHHSSMVGEIGVEYANSNTGYSSPSDAYSPSGTPAGSTGSADSDRSVVSTRDDNMRDDDMTDSDMDNLDTMADDGDVTNNEIDENIDTGEGIAGSTGGMGSLTPGGTGTEGGNTGRSLRGGSMGGSSGGGAGGSSGGGSGGGGGLGG